MLKNIFSQYEEKVNDALKNIHKAQTNALSQTEKSDSNKNLRASSFDDANKTKDKQPFSLMEPRQNYS